MAKTSIVNSALKIDTGKVDVIMAKLLANDEDCKNDISVLKNITGNDYIKIDGAINSLLIRLAEIMYSEGIKEGISFIVDLKNVNMF